MPGHYSNRAEYTTFQNSLTRCHSIGPRSALLARVWPFQTSCFPANRPTSRPTMYTYRYPSTRALQLVLWQQKFVACLLCPKCIFNSCVVFVILTDTKQESNLFRKQRQSRLIEDGSPHVSSLKSRKRRNASLNLRDA